MLRQALRGYVVLLFLLAGFSIVRWHRMDTRPSSLDETRHMQLAIDYARWLGKGVPLTNEWSHVYPPVFHLSLIPALSIGVPSETKAALTHLVYLALFILGCLLLGRQVDRPDWESLFGAFLGAGYCLALWTSRRALIDFPLMAWTTLSMAFLARTKGFSNLTASLQWAGVLSLGLLTKAPSVFFSIGPVLWVFFTSDAPDKTKNFLKALGLAALLTGPWYFWQSAYFIARASDLVAEHTADGADPRTISGWLHYIRLLQPQLGRPSLLFTLGGIILAIFHRRTPGNGLLVAWILSGYVCLSMLMNKDPRHTLPFLPALAILAARGWGSVVTPVVGRIALCLTAPAFLIYNIYAADPPIKEDWQHQPLLTLLSEQHDPTQPFLSASILSHHPHFFARTIKWSAFQRGIPMKTVSTGNSDTCFAEFVVRRDGHQGTEQAVIDQQWQALKPESRAFKELFSERGQFTLPDQTPAVVYGRLTHPQFHVRPLTEAELERRLGLALRYWVDGPLAVKVASTPQGLREGRLDRVVLSCDGCSVKGLAIEHLEVIAEKPWINLYRLWDEGRLGLLAFESLRPSCVVQASGALALLNRVKKIESPEVRFSKGRVEARARYAGIPVRATAEVSVSASRYPGLDAVLKWVWVGGVPLPGWLLGKAHHQTLALYSLPDFPGRILIQNIRIDNNQITIS